MRKGELSHGVQSTLVLDCRRYHREGGLMARFVWVLILTLSTLSAWAAQVYRSVDAEGNVTYGDRPEGESAESIFIAAQRPPSAPTRPSATEQPASESAPSVETTGETERERRDPTPEERAEDRAKNCAIARDREERYAISHRLYRETPDGGRDYLDDAALTEARTQATADVQEWCD